MIAIEVNHPNLAGKSPIFCPEHATSTSLELKVVGYVMEVETYYDSGKEQKFKDQMTADETCLAAYKVNLQKRVSGA